MSEYEVKIFVVLDFVVSFVIFEFIIDLCLRGSVELVNEGLIILGFIWI